jgi:hypothetical protein
MSRSGLVYGVLAAAAATALILSPQAFAQGPKGQAKSLGKFGSYEAYTLGDGAQKVCYFVGRPKESAPKGVKRNDVYFMATNRPAQKVTGELSFSFGQKLKDGSDAELTIGKDKFKLFTKDDSAWARDAAGDKAILAALEKGQTVVAKASPAKGADFVDTYSLDGLTKAKQAIDTACK